MHRPSKPGPGGRGGAGVSAGRGSGPTLGIRLGGVVLGATVITLCSILLIQEKFPSVGGHRKMHGNCRVGTDGRIVCNELAELVSTSASSDGDSGLGSSTVSYGDFSEFVVDKTEPVETVCYHTDGNPCPEEEAKQGPPPETQITKPLSKPDMVLLKRASRVDGAFLQATVDKLVEPAALGVAELASQVLAVKEENGRYNTPTMPRVAFLFLARGPIPLAQLWEKFFDGYEELFTVYVHTNPDFKPPLPDQDPAYARIFTPNIIPSETVRWGDPSMVDAERRLLAHALLKPANSRFVLLSESCLPLHGFPYFYSYLMASNKSFLHSACEQSWNCIGRYSPNMWPTIDRLQWKKGSQWWALTRTHAALAVRDRRVYPSLAHWCKGDSWHRHCFMDEFYFQTLLQIKDPEGTVGRGPTWAAWSGDAHPLSYGPDQLTPDFIKDMKGKMCEWNNLKESCFLLIRKIPSAAVKHLMSLPEQLLGY